MRYVLDNYLRGLGYDTLALDDYRDAQTHLRSQFDSFSSDKEFNCVLMGWQSGRNADADRFLSLLESPDFQDLPAIVLSQETRADSRAWVAGRSQTTLLRWKDYKGVRERLASLLDSSLANDSSTRTVKFSNDDISILVVDDSASIRFALRDLLELHGYRVTVVSSHSEAMTTARSRRFDIAVLDYYLQDSTGDDLCRELLDEHATGNITCAILTGTYSDHIIKSSLRAGAVECMFKNESGELLLARIDAISRMVRQRKSLLLNQQRLDSVIDYMGGPTIVLDHSNQIEFISLSAQQVLGYITPAGDDTTADNILTGQAAASVIGPELPRQLDDLRAGDAGIHEREAVFLNANGRPFPVVYSCVELMPDEANSADALQHLHAASTGPLRLLVFQSQTTDLSLSPDHSQMTATEIPVLTTAMRPDNGHGSRQADNIAATHGLPTTAAANGSTPPATMGQGMPTLDMEAEGHGNAGAAVNSAGLFTDKLHQLLQQSSVQGGNFDTSLLLVEFAFRDNGQLRPVTASPERLQALETALHRAYPVQGEVAYFGSSRFGMLVRHRDMARALMQTRKLMQSCNQLGSDLGLNQTSSIGALTNLERHLHRTSEEVLAYLHRSLSKIAQHTRDSVLLVDHDKMLKIYPDVSVDNQV